MLGIFKRRAEFREYASHFDNCLLLLFSGFEPEVYTRGRPHVDVERIKAGSFEKQDTPPKVAAVFVASMILAASVERMSDEERVEAAAAMDARLETHPFVIGLVTMYDIAAQITDEMHVRMMQYDLVGVMKGMTPEQRHSWWMETEVNSIADGYSSSKG